MIRVVFFLIVVGALSLGVAWLAERPGDVLITWQGMRIETSLMVLGAAVLALMVLLAAIWSLVRAILRSPMVLASFLRNRRGVRAYEAISSGLIAVGSGDVAAARRLSTEVNRIAPGEPLALLLSAQSAQLTGDREAAERTFRTMASRADTKALGLHGLFIEAQRREDAASARAYAEEAVRATPSLGWAARAVLEFRCATGDWLGALAMLESNRRMLDKTSYRRQRAVMLTARALAAEDADRDTAKASALEAVKLAPTLVPAAALAGRLLAEGGEPRKASRIVAKAWRANPHPDLAQTYAGIRLADAARDRLTRIEALVKKTPGQKALGQASLGQESLGQATLGDIEGALAIARTALDAREFGKARAALGPYLASPTRRIALVMAELERSERNDEGRAREWIARAVHAAPDPAWTADGYVSDRWLPVSPITGRIDAFEWRVPLTGILSAPVIEPETPVVAAIEPAAAEPAPEQPAELPSAPPPPAETEAMPARRRSKKPQPKAEPVIPLVHAPDDPGPDAVEETTPSAEPENSVGWRKIFE